MKIIHWAQMEPNRITGLRTQVLEIVEAEKKLGLKSEVRSPTRNHCYSLEDGTPIGDNCSKIPKTAIHVIHSELPPNFDRFKKKVAVLHGTPEYTFEIDANSPKDDFFAHSMNLIHDCDVAVTFHKRHLEYWGKFDGEVKYVPSGIDLSKWSGWNLKEAINFPMRPVVAYMDVARNVKSPRDLLFSTRDVNKKRDMYLCLTSFSPESRDLWMKTISKLYIDKYVVRFNNFVPNPRQVYIGADLVFSHCLYGDITRVGMEALACGCPVISPRSNTVTSFNYKEGSTEHLTKSLIYALDKIDNDPFLYTNQAVRIAERNYDIRETANGLYNIYEKLDK